MPARRVVPAPSGESRVGNWTLAPGQMWWLSDSGRGILAHVAVNGRTLCGRRLTLSLAALTGHRVVCRSCARVMEARDV